MNENYFNYFTEIEEHFQRARGTGLFLLSPIDWALIEAWKNAGIPLEAVLRGIDVAFEKWRARPPRSRIHQVNSLAYCTQAITAEAQAMVDGKPARKAETAPPFAEADLSSYLQNNAVALRNAGFADLADSLTALDCEATRGNLEEMEQWLTALEEKLIARLRASASDEQLLEARQVLDRQLKPYRGKMSAEQLAMLERQFLDRRLLETARLPRLSLFYLTM
ncbi:MAG: hypothetical protein WDO18_15755 [Acidobacteriota bacterium]